MSEQAPGWYPDPSGKNRQRFWDGDGWTEYYQPLAPESTEARGPQSAEADYPYLAEARTTTATPHIPPPQGWQPAHHTWSTPNTSGTATGWQAPQPAAWGHPAQASWGQQGAHGSPGTGQPNGSTQVYRSGSQGGRGGRGGLIAVIGVCVLVLAMLIAGGILAFRDAGSEAGAGDDGEVVTDTIDTATGTSSSVPRNGEWVGDFSIEDGEVYLVDARTSDDGDLQMAVRASGGSTLAYNDDRGALIRMGADRLDPLVVADLEPGDYQAVLTEYRGESTDFDLSLIPITERIEVDATFTTDIEANAAYLAVFEVTETTTVTIQADSQNDADPTLTLRSLDRDALWSDDDSGSDWNALLEDVELTPGAYVLMVAEYFGNPLTTSVQISAD